MTFVHNRYKIKVHEKCSLKAKGGRMKIAKGRIFVNCEGYPEEIGLVQELLEVEPDLQYYPAAHFDIETQLNEVKFKPFLLGRIEELEDMLKKAKTAAKRLSIRNPARRQ